jgi:nucleotide-binding universal stress UspA family protein
MSGRSDHSGIVVGVDGSPCSTAAVRWAAREAAMRNVGLTVVHATAAPVAGSPVVWPEPIPSEVTRQQQLHAEQLIDDAIKTAKDTAEGVRTDSELFFSGPVLTLVDLSKKAQMIVVGCRGRGGLHRVPLGSVSAGLIHHARCPVAVIHDEAAEQEQSVRPPVVVGVDGSPASESATAIAFDEASWRGVDLVALHASCDTDMFGIHALEWAAVESTAHEALAERLAGWQERYPDVTVRRVVVLDRPAHHLLEQSESAQLVVVGSHGLGGFAGMLLGSVSTAVAQAAHVPVIVARHH